MIEKSQKIILLVEDEAVTARLTREILERNGYRVILSQTGEEAVDLIKKNEPVDLILMDIDMGEGIDGTSAASQMLRNRDIPLVFLSAHSDPEFVKKTKEITSYGYVLKNSGEAVLLASIKMALKLYETKEDLKEAEERYRNLFVNSQVGIFIIRLNEGTILEANDCFAHILGFKNRKELLNEPVSIMDFYVDKKIRHQMELILKTNGEINNFEVQFKCRNGFPLWIKYSARIVKDKGWIEGVAEEITDFKKANILKSLIYKELLASEKKYRLIFENSPFGLFYISSKGVIIDCNEAFIGLAGLLWTQIVGISVLDLPDTEFVLLAKKLLNGKSGNYEGDFSITGSNKVTPVQIICEPVFGSNGNVVGGIIIVEDVTEKRVTQRAILDEIEKERSRIGHILHDSLGQKLGAILYLVQAFRRKYSKTGELSNDDLEQISDVASSALEETHALSRGFDSALKDVDFVELLNDIAIKIVSVYGIAAELDVDETITEYDSIKLSNLYYIILESINNSIKHGKAEKIIFKYDASDKQGCFTIESIQRRDFKIENPGMGLRIMQYRAKVAEMGFNISAKEKRVVVSVEMGEKNISD